MAISVLDAVMKYCRRRAAMVFTADDFGRLPGYPMGDGRSGILLAIYSKTSDGTGVLEADKLVTAIRKTSADIEKILGLFVTCAMHRVIMYNTSMVIWYQICFIHISILLNNNVVSRFRAAYSVLTAGIQQKWSDSAVA